MSLRPFWHPLSTILLDQPRCFATDGLVRMLLASEGRAGVIYAGDRMWPAVAHGAAVEIVPLAGPPAPGTVVLVSREGIPDLLRVVRASERGVALAADADATAPVELPPEGLLGSARLPASRPGRAGAAWRRLRLDLREARRHGPDGGVDPAASVRDKYETQAGSYARVAGPWIDPPLLERIRRRVPAGGSVLVVGSGAGRECFALAQAGFAVRGVEFSPAMVAVSRRDARAHGLEVEFLQADVREIEIEPGSLDCVHFTYDVYSFVPRRRARVALLARLRETLRPGGVVFLSARRLLSLYERVILGLQWTTRRRGRTWEWGDTHTRWIPDDGSLRRSFAHVFSGAALRGETREAGFVLEPWEAGHGVLRPDPAAAIIRS